MLEIDRARYGHKRLLFYVAVAAAAAIIAAVCIFDASASMGFADRPTTQRATVGAW